MAGLTSATTPRRQFVRTDFDGASNSSDYAEGVWDQSGNRIPAGVVIAPGTWVSVGGPSTISLAQAQQATGGGQFSIGNQNRLDQAAIDASAAAALLGTQTLAANTAQNAAQNALQQQQLTQTGAYQNRTLDLQGQQLASTNARNAQQHEEVLAQLGLTSKQIEQDYQLNLQRLGLEQANAIRQQKQDAAANALAMANFGLNKDQINATIAGNKATATVDALKWLAERSGPQDWTRQDYIENGQNAPTPTGSFSYSPLDAINEAYKPITTQAPDLNAAMASVQTTPTAAATGTQAATGGLLSNQGNGQSQYSPLGSAGTPVSFAQEATSGPTPMETLRPPTASTAQPPASNYLGTMGSTGLLSNQATGANYKTQAQPGLSRFAEGGMTQGPAIVGDSKSGKPTGAEEIAYARVGKDGKAELHVIPHSALGGLLDGISGGSQGTVHNAKKLPPELLAILPRAANGFPQVANENAGGAFDGGGSLLSGQANPGGYDPMKVTVNKYSPDVMNNTPILRKLRGGMSGNIGFRGYGADGNFQGAIPSQGIFNLPTQLNLRTLSSASVSEQEQAKAAYNNPESGLYWDNIVKMAQRAAPGTAQFGLARAR